MSRVVWATAVYRSGEPGQLTVTAWATGIPERVDYQHAGPGPNRRALTTTHWMASPGSEWREDEPGCFSVTVFRRED